MTVLFIIFGILWFLHAYEVENQLHYIHDDVRDLVRQVSKGAHSNDE